MASIEFFIQYILVAMERILVELMTINKKVRNWAHVKSSMIERQTRCVPSFHKTSDVSTFKIFWFVAVRSFTADSSLLQPTGVVNTTPRASIFHSDLHAHAWLKFVKRTSPDTENHDKNGYAKVYDDNNTFMTNVDNCDTTYTDKHMRNM